MDSQCQESMAKKEQDLCTDSSSNPWQRKLNSEKFLCNFLKETCASGGGNSGGYGVCANISLLRTGTTLPRRTGSTTAKIRNKKFSFVLQELDQTRKLKKTLHGLENVLRNAFQGCS